MFRDTVGYDFKFCLLNNILKLYVLVNSVILKFTKLKVN